MTSEPVPNGSVEVLVLSKQATSWGYRHDTTESLHASLAFHPVDHQRSLTLQGGFGSLVGLTLELWVGIDPESSILFSFILMFVT
ncbi:hypothetical protein [Halobiforma nitratireducens]|uniref:hypothetical protein n=1 Tax=Halobiforma nitratireducens TaxID=130048 RepID=UPI00135F1806